jgi:hypothetical protein
MKTFAIAFKIGCLDLDAIVTESGNDHRFKVEMVTGEPDPIILRRSDEGIWTIENLGGRSISAEGYKNIENQIEAKLASI